MKKILAIALAVILVFSFAACGGGSDDSASIVIAVPNDTTNEARALMLLEANGIITLADGADINATLLDIADNPKNIEFKEVEAAQLPIILKDVDYAVINGNYAIEAGLSQADDALILEGSASAYGNVISVKEGNEDSDAIKALVAAATSEAVVEYIKENYPDGSVVPVIDDPTDGFDATVDYDALAGTTISIACTPAPHAGILAVAKDILAEKDITLDIVEFTDYVQPNMVVEEGELDANFFAHVPYQDSFNDEYGTHLVNVCQIHCEPMGVYGGKQADLAAVQ